MRTLLIAAAALLVLLLGGAGFMAWREGIYDCGISNAEAESEPNWVLKRCADYGYAPAQAWMGILYWSDAGGGDPWRFPSLGSEETATRGLYWMELAAANGCAVAQNELGLAYLDGSYGVVQDFGRARHWLEMATRGGDEIAPLNLARMHFAGLGVPQSEAQAEMMLRVSAGRGYFEGRCSLAALLERRGGAANQAEIALLRRHRDSDGLPRVCGEYDLMRGLGPAEAETP